MANSGVLLLEPGTGEILEIPTAIARFHEEELVLRSNAALASNFFAEWRGAGQPGPAFHESVGYRVPLFLGGVDSVENLEITDSEVYWEITSQLLERVRHLSPGTRVGTVNIADGASARRAKGGGHKRGT